MDRHLAEVHAKEKLGDAWKKDLLKQCDNRWGEITERLGIRWQYRDLWWRVFSDLIRSLGSDETGPAVAPLGNMDNDTLRVSWLDKFLVLTGHIL